MSREVMKMALEALYENTQYSMRGDPIAYQDQRNDDIIEAIKEILAQPAHAPTYSELDRIASDLQALCDRQAMRLGALEAQPDHIVSLTDKGDTPKIGCVQHKCPLEQNLTCKSTQARLATAWGYVRAQPEPWSSEDMAYRPGGLAQPEQIDWEGVAADQAMTIALLKSEQEPVAWMHITDEGNIRMWSKSSPESIEAAIGVKPMPLYTSPPQRQPLTEEEIRQLWDDHTVPVFGKLGINPIVFARAIEAAHGIGDKT